MSDTPRFLRLIRKREAAERQSEPVPDGPKSGSQVWILGISIATLAVASIGTYVGYRYGELSEARAVQAEFSRFVEQSHESIKVLRIAEEITAARILDIEKAIADPNVSNEARACLDQLNAFAQAEMEKIKELRGKITKEYFYSPLGVPEGKTAAYWIERIRDQLQIVDIFANYKTDAYAQFNSMRVNECASM